MTRPMTEGHIPCSPDSVSSRSNTHDMVPKMQISFTPELIAERLRSTTSLGHNLMRCRDPACPQRQDCARWLDRFTDAQGVPHAPSLYQFNPADADEPCMAFVAMTQTSHA
ncbi:MULTISPECIES: hypothetical protein [unclassified Thiocapsa]|uniref:hypothetical protein n=2 Tax=Thiocapsa TaxID=1056 RepID=UPI0035AE3C3D